MKPSELKTLLDKIDSEPTAEDMQRAFEDRVERALRDTTRARSDRLEKAPKIPRRVDVTTTVFDRNPDVVAEVLARAKGICGQCKQKAPFKRKSDGTAYLEVHHKNWLADGGEDTVENAIALCPNCHREAHYG